MAALLKMPDHPIFRDALFDQEKIDLMSSVFEQVCRDLGLSERTNSKRDLVANAILECAQKDVFRRCPNVCFWHKADIARLSPNVRFWG
jgi:hypothetical protein